MADEIHSDVQNKDNHSSSYQETQQRRFSTENNDELIQNGDHHDDSLNLQLDETTENHHNRTQFIDEIIPHSHNESVNNSVDQILHHLSNEQDSFQINQNSFDQSNNLENQDDYNSLLDDHNASNIGSGFHIPTHLHDDKPDELKAQRELDEDEIPPAELPIDETLLHDESHHSSTETETHITDERPLTDLETPYEHHHENDTPSTDENSTNSETNSSPTESETHTTDNHSLTELETPYEHHHEDENSINNSLTEFERSHELNNLSLPDVVTETFEQNHEDYIPQTIELEKPKFEEISVTNENNIIEEPLPPLPSTSMAYEQTNDLNKTEEQPLLSNIKSIPSEPDDILGNKTLLKQTLVEGTPQTRPTRSTLATVSYTLSLVDNLTSDVRIIETVSNESFFISECDTIPAIDICVQFMNRGERALIDADIRHGYGDIGCEEKQIPSINSTNNSYRMKIDLEFHNWISPPDVQTLPIEERLVWGDKKRQMGNFYYRRQDYSTSLQCYRGALRFLDTENNSILIPFDETQRSILNDRYIQVQNNVAQVNLLLNKYEACLIAVQNVLKYDPRNVKALFRQGKALFELGKYDQAIQPLKLFSQIQRGNPAAGIDYDKVNEMITVCENKLANYQKNEKEIYRRMFQPQPTTTNSALNQQRPTKNNKQPDNTNNNWWLYIGLGSAALAAIGLVTFMKYRKTS